MSSLVAVVFGTVMAYEFRKRMRFRLFFFLAIEFYI